MIRFARALFLSVALCAPVFAQAELPDDPRLKQAYSVEGRWLDYYRPAISLKNRAKLTGRLIVKNPAGPLAGRLVRDLDTQGNRLVRGMSVVRVTGVAGLYEGRVVLLVHRVDWVRDVPEPRKDAERARRLKEEREVARLGTIADNDQAPAKKREKALERLDRLGAARVGSRNWITSAAFKVSEGFVRVGSAWVRPEALELAEVREAELRRKEVGPPEWPERGQVDRGQTFARVASLVGFPASVSHERTELDDGRDALWTQWVTKDGQRIYFVDGYVISIKPAGSPWPKGC